MSGAAEGFGGAGSGGGDDKHAKHKSEYKATVDEAGAARKREEHLVKLGRVKKEASQAAKRRVSAGGGGGAVSGEFDAGGFGAAAAQGAAQRVPTIDSIPKLVEALRSGVDSTMLEAVGLFRRMLSREDNPPIDEVRARQRRRGARGGEGGVREVRPEGNGAMAALESATLICCPPPPLLTPLRLLLTGHRGGAHPRFHPLSAAPEPEAAV